MHQTITEALVRSAGHDPADGKEPTFVRDDKLVGFALRITAKGVKSFVVEARVNGKPKRFTISRVERFTVAESRTKAKKLLADMTEGRDPQLARRSARERADTLQAMLDTYIAAKGVRGSTAVRYRGAVQRCISDWLNKPIDAITPHMVAARYEEVAKRSVAEANNFARVLRAVTRRAMRVLPPREDGRPIIERAATDNLAGNWRQTPRKTSLLEPHEVAPWRQAVEDLRSENGKRALMTLLLTGLRVNEALGLRWRDVDATRRKLAIRDSKTGAFSKFIGPELASKLAKWRDGAGDDSPVFDVRDLRTALERTVELGAKRITPHDLRRTYLTFAERSGVPFMISKVLVNHSTRQDVTAGYMRPSEDDLRHWAGVIEGAILATAKGGADVVKLSGRRAR